MSNNISDKKKLEIANICYANVSSRFAMFNNPKYRGEKFNWDWFVKDCEESAEDWMFIHNVRGNKIAVNIVAKQFAKEISEKLVKLMRE